MTPDQLTRAAELAPDCPIVALALLLRIAEQPRGSATIKSLRGPLALLHVERAMNIAATQNLVMLAGDGGLYLTVAGERLVRAACGCSVAERIAERIATEGLSA